MPAHDSSSEHLLSKCLRGRPEVQAAYIFGSAVTGRTRKDSDIDIAVLLDERVVESNASGIVSTSSQTSVQCFTAQTSTLSFSTTLPRCSHSECFPKAGLCSSVPPQRASGFRS